MTERQRKYLLDIKKSIQLIEDFVKDVHSFNDYIQDNKTKAAVERHLAIIGEAINKFQKEDDLEQLKNAGQIISLRNQLIHAYDSIDDAIIWAILQRHVAPLQIEVNQLLTVS